ncbi:hypothetical protein V2J09_019052 [Rumex salicifolius]
MGTETPVEQQQKKMVKQLTGKRDDSPLHSAARDGKLDEVIDILSDSKDSELKELLSKQNQSGETALYVAAETGQVAIITELLKHYDPVVASIKARSGFDAFLIAAKQGNLEILKVLMETDSNLSMTYDSTNTTALQTAATQGHINVVNFLLESGSELATISRSNGKNALHSAARNGHLEVVKALVEKEPEIAVRVDNKGQTALHMAVKGQKVEIVDQLIEANTSSVNLVDNKGNSALHIATRKGRSQIVRRLLAQEEIDKTIVNRAGESAFDTAKKMHHEEIVAILEESGVQSAKHLKQNPSNPAKQLKQTVSDIKHEVHHQLEHTRQTRKRVHGIAKRLNKMHSEGLNNAINSTTVVAVLIATVAFAAIFTVPGQYVDDPKNIPSKMYLGEANIAPNPAFLIFFVFDSFALFISLAVVVVQTSVVVVESKAKKKMMAIINKLMWLACVLISVAFLALSFVVVGKEERWLAISVTIIGTTIMVTTLGLMIYWVIEHHVEAKTRSLRRSSMDSKSRSWSISVVSDSEMLSTEKHRKMWITRRNKNQPEVSYGAEFVPNAEESYTVIILKMRKISANGEGKGVISNNFKIATVDCQQRAKKRCRQGPKDLQTALNKEFEQRLGLKRQRSKISSKRNDHIQYSRDTNCYNSEWYVKRLIILSTLDTTNLTVPGKVWPALQSSSF